MVNDSSSSYYAIQTPPPISKPFSYSETQMWFGKKPGRNVILLPLFQTNGKSSVPTRLVTHWDYQNRLSIWLRHSRLCTSFQLNVHNITYPRSLFLYYSQLTHYWKSAKCFPFSLPKTQILYTMRLHLFHCFTIPVTQHKFSNNTGITKCSQWQHDFQADDICALVCRAFWNSIINKTWTETKFQVVHRGFIFT